MMTADDTDDDGIDEVPVIGLRRNIAQRMDIAKTRIPHFTYVDEVDVTEVERLRGQLNDEHGERASRLTVLPFLMRAVVVAVRDFPQMNATLRRRQRNHQPSSFRAPRRRHADGEGTDGSGRLECSRRETCGAVPRRSRDCRTQPAAAR